MSFTYRNTNACLAHLIRLRNAHRANGFTVPTLDEIAASRTDARCEYCVLDQLVASDDADDYACGVCGEPGKVREHVAAVQRGIQCGAA